MTEMHRVAMPEVFAEWPDTCIWSVFYNNNINSKLEGTRYSAPRHSVVTGQQQVRKVHTPITPSFKNTTNFVWSIGPLSVYFLDLKKSNR